MRIKPSIKVGRFGSFGLFLTGRGGVKKGGGCSGCLSLIIGVVVLLALIGIGVALLPFLLPLIIILAVLFGIFLVISTILKFFIGHEKSSDVVVGNNSFPNTSLTRAIENDTRIVQESLNLVNTSTNIETVIGRYSDLLNALSRLSTYENNPDVRFSKELPSAALARMQIEHTVIMNRAIDRAYANVLDSAANLKTESGRKNRQLKFFDLLLTNATNFSLETNEYVNNLVNSNKK